MRITSVKDLLRGSQWKRGKEAWRKVCNNAGPDVFVRVFGVDRNVGKNDPLRKTFSNEAPAGVVN